MRLGPISLVPDMLIQPIAPAEVASALADVPEAGPVTDRAPDVAGPRRERLADMARAVVSRRGGRRTVIGLPLPGKMGRALRNGDGLPGPDAHLRGPTFADWLRDQPVRAQG
jgi:hypothetical protein